MGIKLVEQILDGAFNKNFLVDRINIFLVDVVDHIVYLVELSGSEREKRIDIAVRLIHAHAYINANR